MAQQKKKPPTILQTKVLQAKVKSEIEDIPQGILAQEIWPNQSPTSASSSMSRMLKTANMRDLLADALEKFNITPEAVTKVVATAMKATKPIGEEIHKYDDEGNLIRTTHKRTADHGVRLKAAGMAAQFMGIGKDPDEPQGGGIHFHQHIEDKKRSYRFSKDGEDEDQA